ncbi:MAG: [protein-PII] uridylyltransferase, partial [Gammaproteobacteria bacterium]|nr:[protein-PII] uridylyltransferase [Gammaproteobacteria bacterium]
AYTLAVEQLMQRYYRTVMDISRVNEMLLQLFQEAILLNPDAVPESLNDDFEVKNGFLQISRTDVFTDNPSAMLEMFLLLQQHPELKGVSANTIALVRRNLHLIDDEFRMNPRNHRLFLQIMAAPQGVTHELRRMNAYGVLGQYIPNFGRIVGRMQYDLFHAYTVDAHTLFVVSNLRRFALSRFDHEYPTCSEIMQSLDNPMIAYLAGLFHDIAKGQGGDHSELGAVSAEAFCLEHGMSVYDSKLVAWLVQHHLTLSTTAQKKDINDPDVIHEFAVLVGDQLHLDYLYLLTVADVRGTNPKLWNDWKAQLFEETYKLTKRALRQGFESPIEKDQLLAERIEKTLALLNLNDEQTEFMQKVWHRFGDDYLLSCRPDEIAWHTRLILRDEDNDGKTLVEIVNQPEVSGTTVLIYAPQEQYTFSIATAVIDEFGLSLADARIIPLDNNCSLSIYTVHEQDGQEISEDARREKLCARLSKAVRDDVDSTTLVTRKAPRQVRMFSTPATVNFYTDHARCRTVMEIVTSDQPGLAAKISRVLRRHDHHIRMAKLVTVGERAEDVFYITDNQTQPLSEAQQDALREALVKAIDGQQDDQQAGH